MKTNIVYLLHFDRPYEHAKHYLGSANDLAARLHEHRTQKCDVRLLQVVKAVGIDWRVARVWVGDRKEERRLKKRGGASRLCPICRNVKKYGFPALFCGEGCRESYECDLEHGVITYGRLFSEAGCCSYCGKEVPRDAASEEMVAVAASASGPADG